MREKLITCQKCKKEVMRHCQAIYCLPCANEWISIRRNEGRAREKKMLEWKDKKKPGVRSDNFYGQKTHITRIYRDEICNTGGTAAFS